MISTVIVKNGSKMQVITWSVDVTKPKCWVEGFYYKFNKELISIKESK